MLSRLVVYCSKEVTIDLSFNQTYMHLIDQAHSCVEKAAMMALVKLRILDTDENFSLRGEPLAQAMQEDLHNKLIPFFVSATLGTTSCCSFDAINEIGQVCKQNSTLPSLLMVHLTHFRIPFRCMATR